MEVTTSFQKKLRSKPISDHAHAAAVRILGKFSSRIRCAHIRLRDVNGPRGGNDKDVFGIVTLTNGQTVVSQLNDSDAYHGIEILLKALKKKIARLAERRQARARRWDSFTASA